MADEHDPAVRGRRVIEETRDGLALVEAIVHALVLSPTSDALHRHPRLIALIGQLGEETEDHNRTLLNFLPAPAFIQLDGTFASVNPLQIKLLGGASRNDFIGEPVLRFVHASSREAFKNLTRDVERMGKPAEPSTQKWLAVDGSEVDVTLIAGPVIFRGRPAMRAIALRVGSHDSLDQLSRSIADCLLESWQRRAVPVREPEPAQSSAPPRAEADDAVLRFAAALAASDDPAKVLRDFAPNPPQRKTIELSHWLRGATFWMREELHHDYELSTDLPDQRIFVSADAKQLAAALCHLAAVATGDAVLSMAPEEDGTARVGFAPVADDPLRLAAVNAIVRRHDGHVERDGARVELVLPMLVGDAVEDLLFHRLFASGPLKILIVVDETLVLSRFGEAPYAHLDIRIISRIEDGAALDDFAPDLLLVDGQQLAIEGVEAFRAVAARRPELEMIICSETAARDLEAPNVTYVPYDLQTLLGSAERFSRSS
jgi:PAS domain S-box-containing protein